MHISFRYISFLDVHAAYRVVLYPTCQRAPSFLFDAAKVGAKKARRKDCCVGWELVGVLVGVLCFSGSAVGVFLFLVGVLAFWWEFGWEFSAQTSSPPSKRPIISAMFR